MGKSFADYQAEHLGEPFPLPMPDGAPVMIPHVSISQQMLVTSANKLARETGDWTPFTGLELIVGDEDAARIARAWGSLPSSAWDEVVGEMQEHFGVKN